MHLKNISPGACFRNFTVFVFPGFLVQFGHGADGFDDSSLDFWAKSLFLTLTKYLPLCRRKIIPKQFWWRSAIESAVRVNIRLFKNRLAWCRRLMIPFEAKNQSNSCLCSLTTPATGLSFKLLAFLSISFYCEVRQDRATTCSLPFVHPTGLLISNYRKIPKISPSKYKPPELVTQKTLR